MKSLLNRINKFLTDRPKLGWFILTDLGRMLSAGIMCVVGGSIETYILPLFMSDEAIEAFPLFRGIMFVGMGILLVYFFIMMYWAIRNTISDIKESRK
jgi:hypothetical protein